MTENKLVDGDDFKASRGWLCRFMEWNGLSLRRKTSIAQQDPERIWGELVSYLIQVRRLQEKHKYRPSDIISMDETPVWCDMIPETTVDTMGKKTIALKSTGHEKTWVSVCLATKADATKLRPMVDFKGGKREVAALKWEFQNDAVVATSVNRWTDAEPTQVWVDYVVGAFAFNRRLLAWDSYECHMEDKITESLKSKKVDRVIVPGGCTKYIKAPDVSWNKPFNAVGIHEETAAGNFRAPPRRAILLWIIDAWAELPTEVVKDSFQICPLNPPVEGSCDDVIHCFKDGQPCSTRKAMLRSRLEILSEPANAISFDTTDSDVEEALDVLDSDQEGDSDIEVDWRYQVSVDTRRKRDYRTFTFAVLVKVLEGNWTTFKQTKIKCILC